MTLASGSHEAPEKDVGVCFLLVWLVFAFCMGECLTVQVHFCTLGSHGHL